MNFLKTIKNKLFKKSEDESINENISDQVLKRTEQLLLNIEKSKPSDLSIEEWEKTLHSIRHAFKEKSSNLRLKSLAKRKGRQRAIEKGFNYFQKYYKNL